MPVARFFYLLFFVFAWQHLPAQQSRQFSFTHFSSINGLASNRVNNVIQDKNGFIWLATLDGLQRYDGNRFLTFRYRPGDPGSIPGDVIRKVLTDKKGNLWVWAGDRIGIFNTSTFRFSEKSIQGNNKTDPFHILLLDDNEEGETVILVHRQGFYSYNENSNQFIRTAYLPMLGDSLPYVGYHHDRFSRQFWFAGYNGMMMFNTKTKNLNYANHNPDRDSIIERLAGQRSFVNVYGKWKDEFWFTTWAFDEPGAPHYKVLNLKTGEIRKYSPGMLFNVGYNEIVGLLHQENGRTWLYGEPFIIGLAGNDPPFQIRNEYTGEQSIKFDKAFDLYEDRQHNLWISTNNGVFVFNPDAQVFVNCNMVRPDGSGTLDGPAVCGLELKDGRVIIGSWGSGIYFYDDKFNPIEVPASLSKLREPDAIWCAIQHTKSGRVWLGLQGGGMIVYDPVTGQSDHFDPEIVGRSTVRQVTEDHEGNLWFGMQAGHVIKWDARLANNDPRKGFIQIRERKNGFVTKLFTDNKGYIWMVTEFDGLHKYDPATNKEILHFTSAGADGKKLWSNNCSDILQYNDSILFVAGGALNVVNTNANTIASITTADGLPSNTVYSVQKDNKGMLWLGMAQGICQMNFERNIFTVYDRRDGIRYDNFAPAGAFKLADGRLLFTSEHSFVVFDPNKISATSKPGEVVITSFRQGNKMLPMDSLSREGRAVLNFNNTSITIDFSSLNFTSQNKIHYHYMMEGIDNDWQNAPEAKAVYNHLPPGSFVFRVRAETAQGLQSDVTSLIIKVQPPFWKTWWFVGLIVFVFIGLIYWLDKQRTQKIRATESVRTRIATSLTEDLSNSLSSINISSELAKTKVDADPQRTKEYIGQISEASNRMMESVYDMVWSINPNNDTMQHTIDRMKIYAAEIENLYGNEIYFDIGDDVPAIDLNMEYRYELLSIFKEALDNAGRHSNAKHVHVNLKYMKGKLVMLVEDDGKGFDADEAAVKRGMTDMRRRAAAINATFHIESERNTGTVVKVVLSV